MSARARAALTAALAALLAHAPALRGGFVNWDDPGTILRNPWLGRFDAGALGWMWSTTHMGHFQPLAWLSLSLDAALWGPNPFGFHLAAWLLHAACAALLALVLMELIGSSPAQAAACGLAAALWAAHPQRVEIVAWATERRELLVTLFALASALAYLRAVRRDRDSPALGPALAFYALACLSKVTAALLPFMLVALDLWVLRRGPRPREKALFFVLSGVTLAAGMRAQALSGSSASWERFGLADRLAQTVFGPGYYAWTTLFPVGLNPLVHADWRAEPGRWAPFALLGLLVTAASAVAAARSPRARAGVFIAFAALAPSLGLFKSGPQSAADRYAHWATWPLAAWAAAALATRPRARRAAWGVLLVLGALTAAQTRVWKDSLSLWTRAAAVPRPTPLVRQNLALSLLEAGREEEGRAALAALYAEHPDSAPAVLARADDAAARRSWNEAAALYAEALSKTPHLAPARVGLGRALLGLKRPEEAMRVLADAVRQDPADPAAWRSLGDALAALGRAEEAAFARGNAAALDGSAPSPK